MQFNLVLFLRYTQSYNTKMVKNIAKIIFLCNKKRLEYHGKNAFSRNNIYHPLSFLYIIYNSENETLFSLSPCIDYYYYYHCSWPFFTVLENRWCSEVRPFSFGSNIIFINGKLFHIFFFYVVLLIFYIYANVQMTKVNNTHIQEIEEKIVFFCDRLHI